MHSDIRSQIMDEIPTTRGIITQNAPLAGINWFRTGGNAEVLFQPADADDLRSFLTELKPQIPITVLGLGSNSLIRDGGVPGIVIHLGKNFNEINFDCEDILAGAGALGVAVSRACRDHSLTGLEFLTGIPGTIGGALRMNAGAYGREISDILISAKALLDRNPNPTREEIAAALDNNLCRCGSHIRILAAVERAAAVMREAAR